MGYKITNKIKGREKMNIKYFQILEIGNAKFYIVKDGAGYYAINDKYIKDNRLVKKLNGIEMYHTKEYIETIKLVWLGIKTKEYRQYIEDGKIEEWVGIYNKYCDEFDTIGIKDSWKHTKFIHLN